MRGFLEEKLNIVCIFVWIKEKTKTLKHDNRNLKIETVSTVPASITIFFFFDSLKNSAKLTGLGLGCEFSLPLPTRK